MKKITIIFEFDNWHNEDLGEKADNFVAEELKAENMEFIGDAHSYGWKCEIPDDIAAEYFEDEHYYEDDFSFRIYFDKEN